jgi:DNA-binding NtrC family response regulator
MDRDADLLAECRNTLRRLPDIEVFLETDVETAAESIGRQSIDLLIADVDSDNGLELFRVAREHDSHLSLLIFTQHPTATTAVECIKLGVADYITKPPLPEEFLATVRHLLEAKRLREEYRMLQWQLVREHSFDDIVGRSQAMREVFHTIHLVSETDVDVLIYGETGTGKELVARSIHKRSPRRQGRFVAVDCGAIPENLLESELFGYEKGAFTGAEQRSVGLLETANHGTFFLDEVGELPMRLQSKLLRALRERKVRRLGGKDEIDLDVRVVAATARDLAREVRDKRFRDDLYYRINVARIDLPPLRARAEDIPLLISHFVSIYSEEMEKGVVEVDPDATEALSRYSWPGNVRELQNVIKRSLALNRHQVLTADDLPVEIILAAGERRKQDRGGFFEVREQRMGAFEKWYLSNLLKGTQGDVSQAARMAQLPRGTLYRLMKKHNINAQGFR